MTWNKVKLGAMAVVLLLLLGGGGVAVWKWQSRDKARGPMVLRSFEPMAGEWEGTFNLSRDGSVLLDKAGRARRRDPAWSPGFSRNNAVENRE